MALKVRQILSLLVGVVPVGCFVDTDKPCRDNEVFDEVSFVCSCDKGYGLTPDGCVKCGKHEVVQSGACVCEEGYARTGSNDVCKEVEAEPAPTGDAGGEMAPESDATPTKLSAEGEGTQCTNDDQCSGFPDAKSCDLFVMTCSIKNCSIEPNNCPDDYACCDVSAFAPGAPNVCIKGGCPTF